MTVEAWPFLIGRNKTLGYQTIVCPAFLLDAGFAQYLAEAAGGEVSTPESAYSRTILGSPAGSLLLVFRVLKAHGQDLGSPKKSYYVILVAAQFA